MSFRKWDSEQKHFPARKVAELLQNEHAASCKYPVERAFLFAGINFCLVPQKREKLFLIKT